MPANNHFFVHIVESPSEDDLLDGRTEGRVLLEALRLSGIPATYNLVTSRRTLEFALRERLAEAASQLRRIPIVHLSMHGNQHGVSLTGDSGSIVEWQELRDLLLPINEQYSGALVVCFSSCFGAAGCKMAMREEGPVPFLAVVGHYGEAAWSDAAVGFVTFYHRLGKAATIFDAVAAMKVASGDNRFDVLLGQRVQQDYLKVSRRAPRGPTIGRPARSGAGPRKIRRAAAGAAALGSEAELVGNGGPGPDHESCR